MLVLVGSNHRSAPVEVRERMSFPLEHLGEAHRSLIEIEGISEGLILSTCNRVEVLAQADLGAHSALASVKQFLAEQHEISREEIDRYTYQMSADRAVDHMFRVASGLDSMILGEPQILGQVKRAYHMAKGHRTAGPIIDRMMQHCLATAKKVRTETGISRHPISVAFAAVELARQIFGELDGRTALLLGAGKMSDLVATHLVGHGVNEIIVASRTFNHAVEAAERVGGSAVNWEDGLGRLDRVDIVVSCTGAAHTILNKKDVARAVRGRRGRPLFLIDIAVPRDIDPKANDLDNVYLYDIDGLQGVVDANLEERQAAAGRASSMIDREVEAFERWRLSQRVSPIIVSLREVLHGVGRGEIERFRRKLGSLDESQERAVEELTRAVIQKILHRPIRRLRSSVERGDTHECADLYREIFGLDSSVVPQPIDEEESGDGTAEAEAENENGRDDATRPGPRRLLRGGREE
jgi:glutamyl-tRNA reductase